MLLWFCQRLQEIGPNDLLFFPAIFIGWRRFEPPPVLPSVVTSQQRKYIVCSGMLLL